MVHPGATLTPHFRDFLPAWVARQDWYAGQGPLRPAGFFRFEDPAGEVGVETHLLQAGQAVYQVPLTYRPAPLAGAALVATAEHSVLGPRWIYDATTDPVWRAAVLDLVATNGVSQPSGRALDARARGELRRPALPEAVTIHLDRLVVAGHADEDAVGVVTGTWNGGSGRLAVLRDR
ncbi:hypothetical protein [Nocardia sp. NRRL S-836]|uniref:maltokinase N-terminal cap-like domain-containing protein n=1 Tax=Nocardia sp. NRRL S-836 TaxID=1519492 RepID=UPI0006AEC8BE|nr:hypothetical protein [Nocardia sp. NRRL S-836]KOV81382.1 hypothetical protein ADL03_28165 [Nocardia sp. NRRL S-836]